jgi:hypothetical protein
MSDGEVDRDQANVMAGRICAAAGLSAQSECELLERIGEFDAANAIRWWDDAKSLAHWLSWCCSMTPGTAREHVRVAKAMRRMPAVTAAFRDGRLSYSKVREITRVVDILDEEQLCQMALTATASQLARMLSGYRSAAGSRIRQERTRTLTWHQRDDGTIDFRIRMPKEEAALVIAALTAAKDQYGTPPSAPCSDVDDETSPTMTVQHPPDRDEPATSAVRYPRAEHPVDTTPTYGYADAILDVARTFLDAAPEDRSGEDRTIVMVHVAAEHLGGHATLTGADPTQPIVAKATESVPAGTSTPSPTGAPPPHTAPAPPGSEPGTHPDPTCQIEGLGGIEPATARRLACDAELIGAIIDPNGEVLALGRTRRFVSRAQRRALMIRDAICQFPACHQARHLQAHHIVPWSEGGPTDLDNLILLCRFHHTAVHEGGITIHQPARPVAGHRWDFVMPDGRPHQDWYDAEALAYLLAERSSRQRADHAAVIDSVDRFDHPEARRILPGWRGERFDLHECVQALFRMQHPQDSQPDEEWEAA